MTETIIPESQISYSPERPLPGELARLKEGLLEEYRETVDVAAERLGGIYVDTLETYNDQVVAIERVVDDAQVGAEEIVGIVDRALQAHYADQPELKAAVDRLKRLREMNGAYQSGELSSRALRKAGITEIPRFSRPHTKNEQAHQALSSRILQARETIQGILEIEDTQNDQVDKNLTPLVVAVLEKDGAPLSEEEKGALQGECDVHLIYDLVTGDTQQDTVEATAKQILKERLYKQRTEYGVKDPYEMLAEVVTDGTFSGMIARYQGSGAEVIEAYKHLLRVRGYDEEATDRLCKHVMQRMQREEDNSEQRFYNNTIVPGNTILEHYTPYSLNVLSHGLQPKESHGLVAKNSRSQQVHFTSDDGAELLDPHAPSITYANYAALSPEVLATIDEGKVSELLAGTFTLSLKEAMQAGFTTAGYTTKLTLDGHRVNDMYLAGSSGEPATFPADVLHFQPRKFTHIPPWARDSESLPFDTAIRARIEELRDEFPLGEGEKTFKEFLDERLNEKAIAETVLREFGIESIRIERSLRPIDIEPYDSSVVIPLAKGYMQHPEHVDGDVHTMQLAKLGIANI